MYMLFKDMQFVGGFLFCFYGNPRKLIWGEHEFEGGIIQPKTPCH